MRTHLRRNAPKPLETFSKQRKQHMVDYAGVGAHLVGFTLS